MKERVCFSFIAKGEKINYVRMYIMHEGGKQEDILLYLREKDQGYKLEVVESDQNCFISHINSISDFYIQMEQDASSLEAVSNILESEEKIELDGASIGQICAALYPEDNKWYRAKCIGSREGKFKVHFIDFGNRCWTKRIAELSNLPKIFEIPNYAKHCELQNTSSIAEWSEEAEKKFVELSADGETIFVVQMKKPDKKALVELFMNEKSVHDELIELCPKATNPNYHDFELTNENFMMDKSIEAGKTEDTI